jgi:uncharacterized protein involved in exopolysaccharide biosynthesis
MTETTDNKKPVENDEIDLIEVFKKIWAGRKIIYKSIAVCFVIGIVIIIGSPKEYRSEVILLEETTSKSGNMSGLLSQFSGLAGLSGLGGTNTGESSLSPELYPTIIKSTPFLLEVSSQKVTESKYDSVITVAAFLDRYSKPPFSGKFMKYTIGLPGTLMGLFRGKPQEPPRPKYPFVLNPQQMRACGELSRRIKVKEGESESTLLISIEMQDPLVAALLTDSVIKCLTSYVVDYRTQKAKKDLEFIEERFSEAKDRYSKAQQTLAYYRDQNKNVILAASKTGEERLQSEFSMASTLYTSLAQQLEQAKIKVQENTPVFKVIEPAKVAMQKSSPKTSLILVAMMFFGVFAGVGIIFVRMFYKSYLDSFKRIDTEVS